jgi:hypothetical protein
VKTTVIRSPRLPKICADLGLEILPTNKAPGPGQTTAGATLHAIYRAHGEGHLVMLLRTLLETEGNSGHVNEFRCARKSTLNAHWHALEETATAYR